VRQVEEEAARQNERNDKVTNSEVDAYHCTDRCSLVWQLIFRYTGNPYLTDFLESLGLRQGHAGSRAVARHLVGVGRASQPICRTSSPCAALFQSPQNLPPASARRGAVKRFTGTVTDLDTLIPRGSGWSLTNAVALNSKGQISGSGTLNGVTSGYVLTPAK
jgi:hypothetical protein